MDRAGESLFAAPVFDVPLDERIGYQAVKRLIDLVVAIPLAVIALPFVVLIAILIRLDSPGPVIFRQWRLGKGGKPFRFYKFRTMYVDARERFPQLYEYRYDAETVKTMRFKLMRDPRLTRVGLHLRRTSLDELPNLWNVVTGDISLVGPRPEIPEMLRYYEPWQLQKFSVKPGVSGLAQVRGRGLLTLQRTITEDVSYVQKRSLALDLKILGQTAVEVVRRQGAF